MIQSSFISRSRIFAAGSHRKTAIKETSQSTTPDSISDTGIATSIISASAKAVVGAGLADASCVAADKAL
jgi:hypothetical protein